MRCFISGPPSFFHFFPTNWSLVQVKQVRQISAAAKVINSPSWPQQVRHESLHRSTERPEPDIRCNSWLHFSCNLHLLYIWLRLIIKQNKKKKLVFLRSQQLNDNFGHFFQFSLAQFCSQDLIMEWIKQGQNIYLAEDFCDNLQQI